MNIMDNSSIYKWLDDLARYFETRDTHGEDMASWANLFNAETARKIKAALTAAEQENARLREALRRIAEAPTDDELRAIHECKRLPAAASDDRSVDRLIRAARQMLEWWGSDTLSLKDCEDDLRFALKAFDEVRA